MEKTLSIGAFTELDEREVMETEGGSALLVGIVLVVVGGAIAIYEPSARQIDRGNDRMAQITANSSGEPCTVKHISILNNISGNKSYTAYPQN